MDMEGMWSKYLIYLAGMLFVYVLFRLVKILYFNDLVFKCYFLMLNKLLNVVDCILHYIV